MIRIKTEEIRFHHRDTELKKFLSKRIQNKIAFYNFKTLCLYETPAHPRFWLVESLLPLFKPLRFHGFDFVLRRFSLGSPICFQFVFAFSRRECGEKMYFLCFSFFHQLKGDQASPLFSSYSSAELGLIPEDCDGQFLGAVGTEDDDAFDVTGAAGTGDETNHAGEIFLVAFVKKLVGSGEIGDHLRGSGQD